jgi:hypothetical protein
MLSRALLFFLVFVTGSLGAMLSLRADDGTVTSELALSAHVEGSPLPIKEGISWKIYADLTDGSPARFILASEVAAPIVKLQPGAYIIHVTYGLSGTTRRVVLGAQPSREDIIINAGALSLKATVGETPIKNEAVRFSIYIAVGTDPEGRLIAENLKQDNIIRLPVGTYRVVSRYGEINAVASADIRVEAGKLIEATLRHRAATVTLKLVNNLGGEAYAGTTFSVLTPGGDTIRDLVGAFPSLILAEGDYILIARNGGRIFTQEFKVRSGLDQDIEVLGR